MTRYIISDGTPENKVVVRDRDAALEIASLVSGFGDTGTATIDEVEDETARNDGGFGSTGTGRAELDRMLDSARKHEMTSHELAEHRASWVRGEMGMGSDADEVAYREKMRKGKE